MNNLRIRENISDKNYIPLVLIHIVIGYLIYLFPILAKAYFLLITFYFLLNIFMLPQHKKSQEILLACAYLTGIEVLFRMSKEVITYEGSKYLVILFCLIGIGLKGISGRGYPYFLYLILLVPSIIVAAINLSLNANFRTNIAFVLSGPVALGFASLFCFNRKITKNEIQEILLYILLPIISTTTYLFFYNPSVRDVLSGTQSNAAASGGFGPNQVSTILGLGMFAIVVRIFMRSQTIGLKFLNLVILGAMTYRAIVTFSRGGVMAAVIVSAAFLFIYFYNAPAKAKNQIAVSFFFFLTAMIITWNISSNDTQGLIDKRYANEDALGREKADIATGRLDLFMEEIYGFLSNPFAGVGASRIKDIRLQTQGVEVPSHNEVGRLMSEHGLLGLICLTILIIKPLAFRSGNRRNVFFFAFYCFWFATINHSGMRIAAPAFLYALTLINVVNDKNPIRRKLLKKP